jgi:hypothetical protein
MTPCHSAYGQELRRRRSFRVAENALVILNDQDRCPGAADNLKKFVEAGGQLIIATGPHTDANSFLSLARAFAGNRASRCRRNRRRPGNHEHQIRPSDFGDLARADVCAPRIGYLRSIRNPT